MSKISQLENKLRKKYGINNIKQIPKGLGYKKGNVFYLIEDIDGNIELKAITTGLLYTYRNIIDTETPFDYEMLKDMLGKGKDFSEVQEFLKEMFEDNGYTVQYDIKDRDGNFDDLPF